MIKMSIKKGDTVTILKGKDRTKSGKVLQVFPKANKVLVEGVNMVKKHKKATQQGEKGTLVSVARPIDRSNVVKK
jgi:large subunit ribosomal protein L24